MEQLTEEMITRIEEMTDAEFEALISFVAYIKRLRKKEQ